MSSLTDEERLGLEDVFLSISKSHKKTHKLPISSYLTLIRKSWIQLRYANFKQFNLSKLLKKGIQNSKNSLYSIKLPKKKKNLS